MTAPRPKRQAQIRQASVPLRRIYRVFQKDRLNVGGDSLDVRWSFRADISSDRWAFLVKELGMKVPK